MNLEKLTKYLYPNVNAENINIECQCGDTLSLETGLCLNSSCDSHSFFSSKYWYTHISKPVWLVDGQGCFVAAKVAQNAKYRLYLFFLPNGRIVAGRRMASKVKNVTSWQDFKSITEEIDGEYFKDDEAVTECLCYTSTVLPSNTQFKSAGHYWESLKPNNKEKDLFIALSQYDEDSEFNDIGECVSYNNKKDTEKTGSYAVLGGLRTKTDNSTTKEAGTKMKKSLKQQGSLIVQAAKAGFENTAINQASQVIMDIGREFLPDDPIVHAFLSTPTGRAGVQALGSVACILFAENMPQLLPADSSDSVSEVAQKNLELAVYALSDQRAEKLRPKFLELVRLAEVANKLKGGGE